MTSTPETEPSRLVLDDEALDTMPLLPEQIGAAEAAPEDETVEQNGAVAADGEAEHAPEAVSAEAAEPFEPVPATPSLQQIQLAQAALDEISNAGAVGDVADARQVAEHVIELRFVSNLEGYPDWFWTASISTIDPENPTVLELALLPSDTSLLAPQWVPWAERMAEYVASKEAEELEAAEDDEEDDDFDDFDDPDASPYSDTADEPYSPEDAEDDAEADSDADEDDADDIDGDDLDAEDDD